MCKYCIGYFDSDTDYTYVDRQTLNIYNGTVNADIDIYIAGFRNETAALKVVNSVYINRSGPYSETMKCVPIKFCPFCGVELKKGSDE